MEKKISAKLKPVLILFLAAMLAAVLLNGCGAGSAPGNGDDRNDMRKGDSSEMSQSEDTAQTDHSNESVSAGTAAASASSLSGTDIPSASSLSGTDIPSASSLSGTDIASASASSLSGTGIAAAAASSVTDIAAAAASASSGTGSSTAAVPDSAQTREEAPVVFGDERADLYLPLLEGKRTAVFSNQTGIVGNRIIEPEAEEAPVGHTEEMAVSKSDSGAETDSAAEIDASEPADNIAESGASEPLEDSTEASVSEPAEDTAQAEGLVPFGLNPDGTTVEYGEHIVDALLRQGVDVTVAFSPEHGFRGTEDAGAQVGDYVDEKTGVPVVSLYGGGSMYPSDEDMSRFDTLVIDIQDVGLRYYTYYISMYYLMDACAAFGKEVVILDRPNPNGYYVDGPVLQDEYTSGVGILPIPVVHGMTLGELAQMINGEGWLGTGKDACSLTVVPCDHYTHSTLTPLVTRPSPNLKDMRAIYLYASTCFFENTACSVGRGTDHPFEIFGSPYLEGADGCSFSFIPESMEGAHSPVFEGQICYGRDLREIPLSQILKEQINLNYVIDAYYAMQDSSPGTSFFGSADGYGHYWIDYLAGTDRVRCMIEDGAGAEEIRASWQAEVDTFKEQRRSYLIYK